MLSKLRHPHIVNMMGFCLKPLAIVMELCDLSLYAYLHCEAK